MYKCILAHFQFFTRLTISTQLEDPLYYLKKGNKFLPFFGLCMGFIECSVYFIATLFLNSLLSFVIVLLFDVLLTGAMHQDALADMADGLFSSREPEKMLAIMKDSRLGTMGVLAIVFYYVFLIISFYSYPNNFIGIDGLKLIIGINIITKSSLTLLFYKMTYAGSSANGLGKNWENVPTKDIFIAQIFTICILFVIFGIDAIIPYFIVSVTALLYRCFVYRKIKGMNGDTLGAFSLISTVVFIIMICTLSNVK